MTGQERVFEVLEDIRLGKERLKTTAKVIQLGRDFEELRQVLESCLQWHQGDNWRRGDEGERLIWDEQHKKIKAAIKKALGE